MTKEQLIIAIMKFGKHKKKDILKLDNLSLHDILRELQLNKNKMITLTEENKHVNVNGINYLLTDEDIIKGDECYDLLSNQFFIAQDDYSATLPGITGKKAVK